MKFTDKMASLENGINGDDQGEHVEPAGTAGDFTDMEAELKREKARAKSNFTQALFLIEQQEKPGPRENQDACNKMDNTMESAMDVMTNLSELYMKNKEKEKNNKAVLEMEKLDDVFATTYAAARQYIDAQKEQSCETSEIRSIDLLNRMNISNQSETYRKEGHNISQEVGIVDSYSNACNSMSLKNMEKQTNTTTECQKYDSVYETEPKQAYIRDISLQNEHQNSQELHSPGVAKNRINAEVVPFEPIVSNTPPSIGQD